MEFLPDCGVVRATVHGRNGRDEIRRLIAECMQAGSTHGAARFLVDCLGTTVQLATAEIYRLPEAAQAAGMNRHCHVAIVAGSSVQRVDFEFYETRAHNLGYDHRLFAQVDEALAWLVSRPG